MLVQETWMNDTKGYIIGESGQYEPFTNDIKQLFTTLQKEYGRCVSKIYIDLPNGEVASIGWVFQKNQRYEDVNESYSATTWITLFQKEDEVTTKHFYLQR